MELMSTIAVVVFLLLVVVYKFSKSLCFITDSNEKKQLITIVILGIIFKCTVVLLWFSIRGDNFDNTWVDTIEYDRTAACLASQFDNFDFFNRSYIQQIGAHPGYNYTLGIIYFIFGQHTWLASAFNIIASISVSLILYFIALQFFNKDVAKYSLILNIFFPNYIPFDFFVLKDNVVVLLLSVAILSTVMAIVKQNWRFYLTPLVIFPVLYFFRGEMTVVLLIALTFHVVVSGGGKSISKKNVVLAIVILGLLLVAGEYLKPTDRSALDRLSGFSLGEGAYGGNQLPDFLNGTYGLNDALLRIASHPVGFSLHVVKSLYLMLLGPTYFYAMSGPALFYKYGRFVLWDNLTGLVKILLAPMIVFGFYTVVRNYGRRCFAIWFFPLAWFCLLLFAQDFFRWILPAIPFLLLFAAIGLQQFEKIRRFYLIYFLLMINFLFFSIMRQDSIIFGGLTLITSLSIMSYLLYRYSMLDTKRLK